MKILNYTHLKESKNNEYYLEHAPEKVLQFGEGNFLRAFVNYWFDIANEKVNWNGKYDKISYMIPHAKRFSPTNLRYMMRFYELFKDVEIIPQLEENLLEKNENQIVPQVGEDFKMVCNKVFMIPWGHIKLLIDKCHDNPEKFNFYIDKIIENNWSRAVLLNFLEL